MLDLILEVFEQDWGNLAYVELIRHFNATALPQILGFKIRTEREQGIKFEAAKPLFRVVAQLLRSERFGLAELWPYLYPEDKDMQTAYGEKLETAKSIAQRANVVRLGSSGQASQDEKEKDRKNFAEMKKQYADNQKLWLMEALVRVNAWAKVEELYYFMKDHYDAAMFQPLLQALLDMGHWAIEPIYRKIAPTRYFPTYVPAVRSFPEDRNGVYQAEDYSTFYHSVGKITRLLGIHISQDPLLYIKICRVIKASFKAEKEKQLAPTDGSSSVKDIAGPLCTKVLLPALSLTKCNPGICTALWEILAEFDYFERYNMYNEWLTVAYFAHPQLMVQYALSTKDTRKWLKRLARGTVRQTGKLLAKLSHSNPCILFDLILTQSRSYENQIQPIVSTLNICSSLALDVISYVLLRHISDNRDKLEADGNISSWLNNLATFGGHFFRKYHWVDVRSVFHYVCGKLKTGCTTETIVLTELMTRMTGYSNLDLDKMTEKQFEAMAGGKTLQIEALGFANDVRRAKTSSQALVQLFWKKAKKPAGDDSLSLAMTLNVLIAQNIQTLLYRQNAGKMKMESNVYDRLRGLFIQFNQFIANESEGPEHYGQLLPPEPVPRFVSTYKLPPEMVFFIMGPNLKPLYEYPEAEYDRLVQQAKDVLDRHIANRIAEKGDDSSEYFAEGKFLQDKFGSVWEGMSPELYAIFWYMKLQDIVIPKERYEDEVARLTVELTTLQKEDKGADSSQTAKKLERNKQSIANLNGELQRYTEINKKYTKFLESRKDAMISKVTKKADLSPTFMQYCMLPRTMFSPSDAIYTIKMITVLVRLRVKLINILDIVGMLLKRMLPVVQCCTEKEAYNFGIFFFEVFRLIHYWQDEHVWKAECHKTPGFSSSVGSSETVSLNEFKDAVEVIYRKVTVMLQKCLDSGEYMQARNALIVLKKLTQYFPRTRSTSEALDKTIDKLITKCADKTDLLTMATCYKGILSLKIQELPDESVFIASPCFHRRNRRVDRTPGGTATSGKTKEERIAERSARTRTQETPATRGRTGGTRRTRRIRARSEKATSAKVTVLLTITAASTPRSRQRRRRYRYSCANKMKEEKPGDGAEVIDVEKEESSSATQSAGQRESGKHGDSKSQHNSHK